MNYNRKLKNIASFGPATSIACAILLLWQLFVQATHISNEILPAPNTIWQAFRDNWDVIVQNTQQTFLETSIGIGIAILLGISTAILLDTTTIVRRAIYPLLITSQTIPIIALAPLFLIWLGFGLLPKVIIVTLYCFFPIAIALADGLSHVDPELILLFKSMNASYFQTMRIVKFPSSIPSFFSGLKIAVTYSMTGAILGEYIGAYQGLGIFIQTAANSHEIPLLFAAIFVTTIVSLLLFSIICLFEKLLLPWQKKTTLDNYDW